MGLTNSSTGNKVLKEDIAQKMKECKYKIAIAGNPNVGKSTIFNNLTGMHQHTGNWPGKTVANATGISEYNKAKFLLVDIPGTYSIMSNSEEEEIARDYICFGNPDATVVILDATSLERNLNLVYQIMEITDKIVVCVNLLDEAKKKGIHIDLKELEKRLGVPVVGTIARKKKTLDNLMETIEKLLPNNKKKLARWISLKIIDGNEKILKKIEQNLKIKLTKSNKQEKSEEKVEGTIIANEEKDENNTALEEKLEEVRYILNANGVKKEEVKDDMISSIVFRAEQVYKDTVSLENSQYNSRDRKIDKVLTSKIWGIPIMLLFLGIIFWLTITGANYPSEWLSNFFAWLQEKIVYLFDMLFAPEWLKGVLIDGVYRTLTWIIAVMLPPMAIFFPLFTLLEDLGFLPRIAFNLDKFFRKAGSSRKASSYNVYGIWL